MEPGPSDTPAPCSRCGSVQLHRPDAAGAMHCLRCMTSPTEAKQPPVVDVRMRPSPIGDSVVRILVVLILFFVIIGVYSHACNAH